MLRLSQLQCSRRVAVSTAAGQGATRAHLRAAHVRQLQHLAQLYAAARCRPTQGSNARSPAAAAVDCRQRWIRMPRTSPGLSTMQATCRQPVTAPGS